MPRVFSQYREIINSAITSFLLLGASCLTADGSTANVCDQAAMVASKESDVPLSVLMAVTRTETGRRQGADLEPWPWSINVSGQGYWHPTRLRAEEFATEKVRTGTKNIDIGCFQLNFRWHGHAFSTVSEMFDPNTNARYAAKFLSQLFDEKGDWTNAVGAFHSRTKVFSDRYKEKYSAVHEELLGNLPSRSRRHSQATRWNQFPLLKPSSVKPRRGSLVPLSDQTTGRSLISRSGGT